MDPITLILTALGAGAAAGGQAVAGDAIKDAYVGLKTLIQRKFSGKPSAEVALQEHEVDPATWDAPLKKALAQAQVDQDREVIEAAQRVMVLVHPQQAAMREYNVQIAGNAQGFNQGDDNTITQYFDTKSHEK